MGLLDSCATFIAVLSACFGIIYTQDFEWSKISLSIISKSNLVDDVVFSAVRLSFALVVLITLILSISDEGLHLEIMNREGKPKPLHVKGFGRLTFFTYWAWIIEGIYFLITGILSLLSYLEIDLSQSLDSRYLSLLLRATWSLYEVNFALAYLVSIIVTYVLIGTHIKDGISTDPFFKPIALLTHNANVVFMASEFILNQLHFSRFHFVFAILFGLSYTLFSWYYYTRIGVFYYFFLDYARKDAPYLYILVMSVVSNSILYIHSVCNISLT